MNITHKCHFHPENPITKFCPLQACTLPLCQICQTIHLQEHKSKLQEVKLIRFNQAYLNAINGIEDYLELQRKSYREMQRQIESDKEAVMRFIGTYYNEAVKSLEQVKNKMNPLEEKLGKLKKGSIKTLIFYYSGDIKLDKQVINFEPLIQKLNVQHTATKQVEEQQIKINPKQSEKRQNSNTKIVRHNNEQTSRPKIALDENVFEGIQQPKLTQKQRQKRRSIFDNTKKSTVVQVEPRERINKYSYNIENQEEIDLVKISPTFKNVAKNNIDTTQLANREISYKIEKKEEPLPSQIKMSFENQMMNKFTGSQQYQAYKKQREDKLFQQINYHQNRSVEEKQPLEHKILKTSDLEVEKTNTNPTALNYERSDQAKQNIGQRNYVDQGVVRTERLRSLSQANIVNRETAKDNIAYDLKKQVLSPQEIRKMLEKRIEERNNKILSMKKTQVPPPADFQDYRPMKKWGETKVSIINQIYDPKY